MASDPLPLQRLLEALPQELYDIIYDETFSVSDTVNITADYTFPSVMQVNKASRAAFSGRYYSKTTFVMPEAHYKHGGSRDIAEKWVDTLTHQQKEILSDLRCRCGEPATLASELHRRRRGAASGCMHSVRIKGRSRLFRVWCEHVFKEQPIWFGKPAMVSHIICGTGGQFRLA